MIVVPAVQPIKCTKKGMVVAAEVLARVVNGSRLLNPAESQLNWHEIDLGCVKALRDQVNQIKGQYLVLFINISAETLECDNRLALWLHEVCELRQESEIAIIVEVVETVPDRLLMEVVSKFEGLGLKLALDDFGTANSTLERLKKFSWLYCKFDAQRIKSLADREALSFCRKEGIIPIVEQVETLPLCESALLQGINLQQGFYHYYPQILSITNKQIHKGKLQ